MSLHNFDLHSGERQTASNYNDIRADHRFRYEWAETIIPSGGYGLDIFCGNGYGTWLLGKSRVVLGIDGSEEAINMANLHFKTDSTLFAFAQYPFTLPEKSFDFIVSLESIEHIADGKSFFKLLCQALKPGGQLIFSTPCEDFLPHSATDNHFHHKHYSFKETIEMAASYQLELIKYCGQDTYEINANGKQGNLLSEKEMLLKPNSSGQFIVVHARKEKPWFLF